MSTYSYATYICGGAGWRSRASLKRSRQPQRILEMTNNPSENAPA